MYMKYSLLLRSLPSSSRLFFPSLHPSVSGTLLTSGRLISSKVLVERLVFAGNVGGITRIPPDSGAPPSDASHLRHGPRRPSKPSARLPLIDLSLVGGVSWPFGENLCFDRFLLRPCFLKGRNLEYMTLGGGEISLHHYAFKGNSVCIWKPCLFSSCFRVHEVPLQYLLPPTPPPSPRSFSTRGSTFQSGGTCAKMLVSTSGGGGWSPCLFNRAWYRFKTSFLSSEVSCLKHLNQEWVFLLSLLCSIMAANLLRTHVYWVSAWRRWLIQEEGNYSKKKDRRSV